MEYNLIDEQWIPVLWTDGRSGKVGIREALTEASRIRQIAASEPLDSFALHRFLLTLLYWKANLAGSVEQVRKSLLDGDFPVAVFGGIEKEAHCFDLFDKQTPFLQDASLSNAKAADGKSPAELFAELSKATNVAHFYHGDDENLRLCLPCVALGMLRVVSWTQSGGQGKTPSIHNAPPIMALALGENLGVTLGLNLVPLGTNAGKPQWSGHFNPTAPSAPIPYLEAFTWNPRRILLPAPEPDTCWYCGDRDVDTIGKIAYVKNDHTKKRTDKKLFEWQDPAAFYAPYDPSQKYDKDKNVPYKTIKSSREELAASDRDLTNLTEDCSPLVFTQNMGHENWLLVIPSTNPANNKTFDHRQIVCTNLSPLEVRTPLPEAPKYGHRGMDGWETPVRARGHGIERFVHAAEQLLTQADWTTLANASYQDMHYSPAAFNIFSGLYWGLLQGKASGLPSRNVAWLMLKLMASVPSHARVLRPDAKFCPYLSLPKRQLHERDRPSQYPVSFPRGVRLEAALRSELTANLRKRNPEPIDWTGLCDGLNQILE